MQETTSLKQKEEEWASVIRGKRFSFAQYGQKKVEGRCGVGHCNKYDFIMTCMHFAYSIDCFCRLLIKHVVLNADSQGLSSSFNQVPKYYP
ncbi:hypothetical protein HAX54_016361 [Datura stramonium]|uniref:Uncharacterized protein n=1 Tax=Datura stramonium TaxID=4076 RepID=A0ABS8S032_DATST|nr:hypothetical protein [Datura stramonium]